jgi:hypothetical protein
MRKISKTMAILFLIAASVSLCHAQNKSANEKEVKIQLVARYYNNGFFDISSDSKLLLLFGPRTPIKESRSHGLTEWKPKRSERYSGSLRVVEWETGRELGIVTASTRGTTQRPPDALFVEGTNQVCIKDFDDLKLWNYVTGHIDKCKAMPKPYQNISKSFYEKRESPDSKYKAEVTTKKLANLLVVAYVRGVITISDRATGKKIGEAIHPIGKPWAENPTAGDFYGIALTQDNKYLLTYYGDDTFVWRIGD